MAQEFFLQALTVSVRLNAVVMMRGQTHNFKDDLRAKARETFYFCWVPEMEMEIMGTLGNVRQSGNAIKDE